MNFYATAHYDYEYAYINGSFDIGDSLQFGTVLNGGFADCSFSITQFSGQAGQRARGLLGNHVIVYDENFDIVYQGKVAQTSVQDGVVSVVCAGYFSDGNKKYIPTTVMELWTDPTVTDVLNACIGIMDNWNKLYAGVSGCDLILTGFDGEDNIKVTEMIERSLKFGLYESSAVPGYFAIYENRIPKVITGLSPDMIDSRQPDWIVYNEYNLSDGAATSLSIDDVYNTVYLRYDDNADDGVGPTLLETPLEDYLSKGRYGELEGIIDVGQYGLALGQDLQALALSRFRYPRKKMSFSINGLVRWRSGYLTYPYRIRAGDTILVADYDIESADWNYRGENSSGFVSQVMKTSYDASSNQLSLDVTSGDSSFEYYMSRLGLDGGLG